MRYSILLVAALVFFAACSSDSAADTDPVVKKATPIHYQLAMIEKHGVASVIKLPGQIAAYEEVSIYPRVNGYVKSVLVDIGSQVSKGQLLMELEAPELLQATVEAREKYARSQADLSMAREHYQRLLEASQTAGAISPLDLSTLRSRMMADSALSNAEKSNWQVQQTMLSYLSVSAPFDGVITERNIHPGALINASAKDKPMLELKQVAHLRLQVDIPENLAVNLKDHDSLSFYTSAQPGRKITGYISRKSMNVNTEFRSERMEADIMNRNGRLSPGMYADVLIYSNGDPNGLSVPRSAVVTSTERKFIIVVRDGKTVRVDVRTGNANDSDIEVIGAVQPGEKVIANASDDIKDGTPVK